MYALFDLCLQGLISRTRASRSSARRGRRIPKLWERPISYSKLRARRSPRLEVHPAAPAMLDLRPLARRRPSSQAVGSGFFGPSGAVRSERDTSPSMMSSISSLAQLDMRSSSPSPFTPSGRKSPSSPTTPGAGPQPADANEPAFHATVDILKKGHLDAAKAAVRPGPMRDELEDEIERDCENLRSFLYAAQASQPAPLQATEHC